MEQASGTAPVLDGRRARGDASRRVVLQKAVDIASVEGLEGLTIGRLAESVGASKSGVAALFGSKEQLQLATVEAARARVVVEVVEPARLLPRGLARVVELVRGFIAYSEDRVFPGGCFFAATAVEFDSKPGAVRTAVVVAYDEWEQYLAASIGYAVENGELRSDTDAALLAFEFSAVLDGANTRSLMHDSSAPYERARRSIGERLHSAGGDRALLERAGLLS